VYSRLKTKPNQSWTRRPASADRTACRQFQATGQPVSRTQASDAMTSQLPRYEAKCVQQRCFQCESVALHSDMKGTELTPANILIPLERQLIVLQLCRWEILYNETLQQTFRPLLSKLSKRRQIIPQGRPLPPEVFARTDISPPDSSESWYLLPCSTSTVRDRKRSPITLNPSTGNRGWTRAANWQLSCKCGCSRRALPV